MVSTESEKVEGRLNRIFKSSQVKNTNGTKMEDQNNEKDTEGHFYRYDKGNVEY